MLKENSFCILEKETLVVGFLDSCLVRFNEMLAMKPLRRKTKYLLNTKIAMLSIIGLQRHILDQGFPTGSRWTHRGQ